MHLSDEAVEIRTILHARSTVEEGRTHAITSIKGHLKVYGIKLGKGSSKSFREKVELAIAGLNARVQKVIISLLNILDTIEEEIKELDRIVKSVSLTH